jgi:hypothetical protein
VIAVVVDADVAPVLLDLIRRQRLVGPVDHRLLRLASDLAVALTSDTGRDRKPFAAGRGSGLAAHEGQAGTIGSVADTHTAAQRLKVTERAVRDMCAGRVVKATKVAGRWHIDADDLAALVATRSTP